MIAGTTGRREDIDALRVAATYLLFVFHGAMVFNPAPFYHIRNGDLSLVMLVVCGFIGLWHMPLFFLLAGWASYASLTVRGRRAYLRERVRKLCVPLVAGVILFGPIIKFFELRSGLDLSYAGLRVAPKLQDSFRVVIPTGLAAAPPFSESFFEFLPTFFTHLERFTWAHLWFIAYLFTFSLLYVPLLPWIARRAARLESGAAWLVYIPILPLALIQLMLRERWPGIQNLYDDWANVAYYTVYFLAGVVIASQPQLERRLRQESHRALLVALATTGVLLLAVLKVFSATWVVLVGSAIAGWCFNIVILGFGDRVRRACGRALPYLRDSAFPVYILHQVAIVVPGYFIIQLPLGIAAKFVFVLLAAITVTLGLYQFVVRPFGAVAFLFGANRSRAASLPLAAPTVAATVAFLVLSPGALGASLPATTRENHP